MKILYLGGEDVHSGGLYEWLRGQESGEVLFWREKPGGLRRVADAVDFAVSYNYRYLIPESMLAACRVDAINLHISLLPYNRGAHPNLWSFLENTPKGITIHRIDRGLDTGPILLQEEVSFDESRETLRTSYEQLHARIKRLFQSCWPALRRAGLRPRHQPEGGTCHRLADFEAIRSLLPDTGWDTPVLELKRRYARWERGEAG